MLLVKEAEKLRIYEDTTNDNRISHVNILTIENKLNNNWLLTNYEYALKIKENVTMNIKINIEYENNDIAKINIENQNKEKRIIKYNNGKIESDIILCNNIIYTYNNSQKKFVNDQNHKCMNDIADSWYLESLNYYLNVIKISYQNINKHKEKCKVMSILQK